MKKSIKGKTVKVILSQRVDQTPVNQYGDIWEVFGIGQHTVTLVCGETLWTPSVNDIKEFELPDNEIVPMREVKRKFKYPNWLYE